jgi:hypothetical protein
MQCSVAGMDSLPSLPSSLPIRLSGLPVWARTGGRDVAEADAAFAAGIALKSLDDLVRMQPAWVGCWRSRQALTCAGVVVRMMGRNEDEAGLRDAVLLTAFGDDPGPAGKLFLATQKVSARSGTVTTAFIRELADLMALGWDEDLAAIAGQVDAALQSQRAVPFAVADFIAAMTAVRPDAEALAFLLADSVLAQKLKWPKPVPLLLSERYGPAFRTIGGRGRVRPGEAAFARAICLGQVDAIEAALRSAAEIARRADQLQAVAPKLRTKGAGPVIQALLNEDAIAATASGSGLSRWAATRLFERLESFGAVRELSGRSSFRIYGL